MEHFADFISQLKNLTKFQTLNRNCFLLGFFEKDDDLKAEFMKSAAEMREKYKFVHTQSEEVMADKGHREYVNLTFFLSSFLKVFIFVTPLD